MKKWIRWGFCAAFLGITAGFGLTSDQRVELRDYLKASIQTATPGRLAYVLVVKDDEPMVFTQGLQSDETIPLGNASRALTSLLAARLIDDDRLYWEEPATDLYVRFRWRGSDASRVLFADLMAMTAGVDPQVDQTLRSLSGAKAPDVFALLGQRYPAAAAGTGFFPAETSAAAAGWLLVVAAGYSDDDFSKQFRTLSQRELEGALGIEGLHWDSPGAEALLPAVGAHATTAAIAQWLAVEAGEGEIDGQRLISAPNVRYRWQPRVRAAGVGYAPGWRRERVSGQFLLLTGGQAGNGLSIAGVLPERDAAFFLFVEPVDTDSEMLARDVVASTLDFLRETANTGD